MTLRILGLLEANRDGIDKCNWTVARHIGDARGVLDAVTPGFRAEITKKARDQVEVENFRMRAGRLLAPSALVESGADGLIGSGALQGGGEYTLMTPAGAKAAAKSRGDKRRAKSLAAGADV